MSDIKYTGHISFEDRPPEGMSWFDWRRQKERVETERYLNRNESRVFRSKEDLAALMDRGEVFIAAELSERQAALEEAQREFELAAAERKRMQKHRRTDSSVQNVKKNYTRERFED